jgi:predicted PurR-regulated permease PerM
MNHRHDSARSLFADFPWEKALIWGLFLLFIIVLRHFFAIFFLTFIVSYSMRSLVVGIDRRLGHLFGWKGIVKKLSQPIITVVSFLGLLGTLYGIGSYLVPEFIDQTQGLVKRMSSSNKGPKAFFDETLRASVGKWLFQQQAGTPGSEQYEEAFRRYRNPTRIQEEFSRKSRDIEDQFAHSLYKDVLQEEKVHVSEEPLPEWVLRNKAPSLYASSKEAYTSSWEDLYRQQEFEIPGLTPLSNLSDRQRQDAILKHITNKILSDPLRHNEAQEEWELANAKKYLRTLREKNSNEFQRLFSEFYKDYQARASLPLPFDASTFLSLRGALVEQPDEFPRKLQATLEKIETPEVQRAREQREFEFTERTRLVQEWKNGELASKLQKKIEETVLAVVGKAGTLAGEIAPKIVLLPFQIGLVLLLSFLITLDLPRLQKGITRLKASRVSSLYDEIAPGIVSFGRLMGRAFQAQAVIAFFNMLLTLVALQILGIENKVFLSTVVFLCSFIPVLGVVFSSVPIAIIAIVQPDGSVMLAVWSIVAVLLVHFIETSILNPRILGNMLHLEPVLVLAILAIGEHFFGVWGLLLGVPIMVYIIRVVILKEGIPGLIDLDR